jgi:hypothetical protein
VEGGEEGGAGQGQQAGQQLQAEGDHAPHSGGQEPGGAQNKTFLGLRGQMQLPGFYGNSCFCATQSFGILTKIFPWKYSRVNIHFYTKKLLIFAKFTRRWQAKVCMIRVFTFSHSLFFYCFFLEYTKHAFLCILPSQ